MFFAVDQMMRSRGQLGQSSLVVLKLRGEIDADRLRSALARMFAVHPLTGAALRIGLLWRRPYWVARDDPAGLAARACRFHDMRNRDDWPRCAEVEFERGYSAQIDPREAPQTRLDCCAGPGGETLIGLHCSHAMMDAEGSQLFLAEMNRLDESPDSALPADILPDGQSVDPLAGMSLRERAALFRRMISHQQRFDGVPRQGLCHRHPSGPVTLGLRLARLERDVAEQIEARARASGPAGRGIVARYAANCLIRSLHALYAAQNVDQPWYLVALPVGMRPAGPRPVPGNYLSGAVLGSRRERVVDVRLLAADLLEQLDAFHAARIPQASWTSLQLFSHLWVWPYSKLVGSKWIASPISSGFSFLRDAGPSPRRFVGAELDCYWGFAPITAPPGWNPIVVAHDHCWTIGLTWARGYVDDSLADTLLSLFHRALVEGPDSVG